MNIFNVLKYLAVEFIIIFIATTFISQTSLVILDHGFKSGRRTRLRLSRSSYLGMPAMSGTRTTFLLTFVMAFVLHAALLALEYASGAKSEPIWSERKWATVVTEYGDEGVFVTKDVSQLLSLFNSCDRRENSTLIASTVAIGGGECISASRVRSPDTRERRITVVSSSHDNDAKIGGDKNVTLRYFNLRSPVYSTIEGYYGDKMIFVAVNYTFSGLSGLGECLINNVRLFTSPHNGAPTRAVCILHFDSNSALLVFEGSGGLVKSVSENGVSITEEGNPSLGTSMEVVALTAEDMRFDKKVSLPETRAMLAAYILRFGAASNPKNPRRGPGAKFATIDGLVGTYSVSRKLKDSTVTVQVGSNEVATLEVWGLIIAGVVVGLSLMGIVLILTVRFFSGIQNFTPVGFESCARLYSRDAKGVTSKGGLPLWGLIPTNGEDHLAVIDA